MQNSVSGSRRHMPPLVFKHIKVDKKSSYAWGKHQGLPAIFHTKCEGKGHHKIRDGGLACYHCWLARKSPGNSNPTRWITKCYHELKKCEDRRVRSVMTTSDVQDIKRIAHMPISRHAEDGLKLHEENRKLCYYVKDQLQLNKKLLITTKSIDVEKADSVDGFLQKAANLHRMNTSFRSNIIICLLKAMMAKKASGVLNLEKESKTYDFFRYLRTLSPQASMFASANCGLEGKAVSDRWLRVLNQKNRGNCIYLCDVKHVYSNVRKRCEELMKPNIHLVFSLAIDATKVPKSLNINATRKCVMGASHPNHLMFTEHLSKEELQKVLDNKDKEDPKKDMLELASEVKIGTICFQNQPKGVSPMRIIAARPQGVNAVSSFTRDLCQAACLIERDLDYVRFTNFATDGVSVETSDILLSLCEFLDGKHNFCAAVDNKHNVKNDRYQLIGGSNAATIGNYYVDTNLLLMSHASSELIVPKDFASDKKVEELFSYNTIEKVDNCFSNSAISGITGDFAVLCVTWFFCRLHLHAVNGLNVPAKHRAMYLGLSLFWFTSIAGISEIPKRNMTLESIGNIFLGKFFAIYIFFLT